MPVHRRNGRAKNSIEASFRFERMSRALSLHAIEEILDARLRNVVVCSINSMILFGERCNTFEIESGRPCSICSILISY